MMQKWDMMNISIIESEARCKCTIYVCMAIKWKETRRFLLSYDSGPSASPAPLSEVEVVWSRLCTHAIQRVERIRVREGGSQYSSHSSREVGEWRTQIRRQLKILDIFPIYSLYDDKQKRNDNTQGKKRREIEWLSDT
jgi:hypothetical protein